MGHQVPFSPEVPGQGVRSILEVFKSQQPAFFVPQQRLEFCFRDHVLTGDLEAVHLYFQGVRQIQYCFFMVLNSPQLSCKHLY